MLLLFASHIDHGSGIYLGIALVIMCGVWGEFVHFMVSSLETFAFDGLERSYYQVPNKSELHLVWR